jgi:hypothetical protein
MQMFNQFIRLIRLFIEKGQKIIELAKYQIDPYIIVLYNE